MRYRLEHEEADDPDDDLEGIDFRVCDKQARKASTLGALPLVVVAGANHAKDQGDPLNDPALVPPALAAAIEQQHLKTQAELAQLSTRGRFVIAQESGHFVHLHEPGLVVGVIKALVEQYQTE